jgi:hypothetical protein
VRPGNSWDLRGCTQKPGESLRDFIWRFSKRFTELPSVAQEAVGAIFDGKKGKHVQGAHEEAKAGQKVKDRYGEPERGG